MERKHLPDADVAKAGGWSDLEALRRCYQQADDETLLAVVTGGKELRTTEPAVSTKMPRRLQRRVAS